MDRVLNDRYELRQHHARGGMADVYHGWDRRLSREVAGKVLRPELSADADYVDRFRDEARTAARLAHPNIRAVYGIGTVRYEMVTARKPFMGAPPAEVAGNVLHSRPSRHRSINPSVSPSFEGILSKAMARDPVERYQTAGELRADLLECGRGG